MKIFKTFKSGFMLPFALVMVTVMVIITSSLLNNTDFAIKSEYTQANKLKAESLARTGLENITFLLRNLASSSETNMGVICTFLPRLGGAGDCDSENVTLLPSTSSFDGNAPFSNWTDLPDTGNDNPDDFNDDEKDANRCGISGSFTGRDAWPEDLIRNFPTTFYISGSKAPGGGNVVKSQSLLQTLNLGVIQDNDLNPGDQGFTLESWVYFPESLTDSNKNNWPRVFDFGNPGATANNGNSNIVLTFEGSTGKLVAHYYQPTGQAKVNQANNDANKTRFTAAQGIDTPNGIWAHVFMTVEKDMFRMGLTCNNDSMANGVNNAWLSTDGPNTSNTAKTSLPSACNSGATIYKEKANPTDSQNKKIVPTGLDADGWVTWVDNPNRPNNGVPYTSNYIGRSNYQQDSVTNAFFHNARVWKRALTKEEIQDNIENDLAGISISTTTENSSNSAILTNKFLRESTRMSPRYDHGTHFLRYFTVLDTNNPNNVSSSAFPFTFRVMSCSWSKKEGTQASSTFSSVLRYGVTDDGRGIITNVKRY